MNDKELTARVLASMARADAKVQRRADESRADLQTAMINAHLAEGLTLEEVAVAVGLTRQRVNQIIARSQETEPRRPRGRPRTVNAV